MGFSTTVFFLNDFWHDVEKDPEGTIRFIKEAMNSGGQNRNHVTVMRSHHNESFGLFATWHGSIMDLNRYAETIETMMQTDNGRKFLESVVHEARRQIDMIDALLVDT